MICSDATRLPFGAGAAHAAITSPPYWGAVRSYEILSGTPWPAISYAPMPGLPPVEIPASSEALGHERSPFAFVGHLLEVFRETRRVLRPDGVLVVNLGDCYSARGRGGKNRGANGNGGKKQYGGRAWDGTDKGLTVEGMGRKNLLLMPARLALAMQGDGWVLRSRMPGGVEVEPDIIWKKPTCVPSSATDRPTDDFEDVLIFSQAPRYSWDLWNALEPTTGGSHSRGNGGKAGSKGDPGGGIYSEPRKALSRRNFRAVWPIQSEPTSAQHFASYPSALVRRLLKIVTSDAGCCSECGAQIQRKIERDSPSKTDRSEAYGMASAGVSGNAQLFSRRAGGERELIDHGFAPSCDCGAPAAPCRVLDPFAGIGRTEEACRQTGRRYMGADLALSYCRMHNVRLAKLRAAAAGRQIEPREILPATFEGPLFQTANDKRM